MATDHARLPSPDHNLFFQCQCRSLEGRTGDYGVFGGQDIETTGDTEKETLNLRVLGAGY